ncbi:MAG: arylesterase [Betaproteobacteria bacterium RIFCSPLOWO2_02_FULL_65_24]|nr:MAG: arylesterase [Betaproteobacteria bacterium RIFCSPLOWO2_02_FULL_65_24]OGA89168.1 MAG: arylesterase [Betaproteobacteria bacterium RIFCSPLOWO2_12_FULL_66_14]
MRAPRPRAALAIIALIAGLAALCQPAFAQRGTIMVYGDSLSAAYGIGQKQGWVALLEERLRKNALDYTVVNSSISGETSSGGASRISATLAKRRPHILILELGANDGLRGLPVKQMRDNLASIIQTAQKAGSRVLLVGMKLPPNYGPAYTKDFENVYRDLARQYKLPQVPFFLDGVADKRELFQDDQLHPAAAAQPVILETVWKSLRPMLR